MAQLLKWYFEQIPAGTSIWFSQDDIALGTLSYDQIAKALTSVDHAIVCVTPENVRSPWLNFEAGALIRRATRPPDLTERPVREEPRRLIPLLLDIRPGTVNGPLTNFQATKVSAESIEDIAVELADLAREGGADVPKTEKLRPSLLRVRKELEERLSADALRVVPPDEAATPRAEPSPDEPTNAQLLQAIMQAQRMIDASRPPRTHRRGRRTAMGRVVVVGPGMTARQLLAPWILRQEPGASEQHVLQFLDETLGDRAAEPATSPQSWDGDSVLRIYREYRDRPRAEDVFDPITE